MRFYVSFSWGGCRLTRANELESAKKEAVKAASAMGCYVSLLDAKYKVLGRAGWTGNGYVFTDTQVISPGKTWGHEVLAAGAL